jgi:AcrR family transcriptional regulator
MAGKKISQNRAENGRAWQRRAEHRPGEILTAARELLEQHGYAAVSMAEIGRRAGVSEATLYKYFKNRQDLLNHVLTEWATPFIHDLEREIVLVTGLRAKLTLIAIRYLRGMAQTPRLHRVIYREVRWDDYFGSPMHRLNQRFAVIVVNTVQEAVRRGEAAQTTNPATVRDMLFGGLEHIAQRTIFADRPVDIESEAATLANLLVDGIATRNAQNASDAGTGVDQVIEQLRRAIGALEAAKKSTDSVR